MTESDALADDLVAATADDAVAATYAMLLSDPDLDLHGLAERLARPVADIAAALDMLVELSLVQRADAGHASVLPVNPALAMQQLIMRERVVLDERQRRLERSYQALSSVLADFATPGEARGDHNTAERIVGVTAVRTRLQGLATATREEVLSFTTVAANPSAGRASSRPLDLASLDRGVRMRTLYLDTIAYEPTALEYADELARAGAEIRVSTELPLRLIIADRKVAVVPANPGSSEAGALIIRDEGTLTALIALFESYWRNARPLRVADGGDEECAPLERAILAQLATGAKDEAVARQLGFSVRSLRRIVADLSQRLDARSRFELGVRAASRGWL